MELTRPWIGRRALSDEVMLRRLLCSCVLVLGTLVAPASAQSSGSEGVVIDESRGAVAGAVVELVDGAGRVVSTSRTAADGAFVLPAVPPGQYELRVHHEPFAPTSQVVTLPAAARIDLVLKVPQLVEAVSVAGTAPPRLDPTSPANPYRVPVSGAPQTQVITLAEIQASRPVTVFDVVNAATGTFSTSSGKKGFNSVRIRGDGNLVWIVDGAYLPSQVAGRILQSLPVGAIEQVEVIRGSSALTLAPMVGFSNPSGAPTDGFIVVRTRRAQRSGGFVRTSVESNDTPAGSMWLGTSRGAENRQGRVYGSALLSYFDTAGPDERLANGHPYNLARHAASGLGQAGYARGGFNLNLMYFRDVARFQVPNSSVVAGTTVPDNWEMDPSHTDLVVGSGLMRWTRGQTTLFSLSHTRTHQKLNGSGSAANANFVDGGLLNDNRTTHLNVRHTGDVGGFRLTGGGDVMQWHTPTGQNSYEGLERKERITGFFGQVERRVFGDRLALDASVRRDRVLVLKGVDYFTGGAQPPQPPPLVTDRLLAPAVFATLGVAVDITERVRAIGRLGRSGQDDANLNPVPGLVLEPERQTKWEAGIDLRPSTLFGVAVTGFHRGTANEKSVSGYSFTRVNGTSAVCFTGTVPTTGATAAATSLTSCYAQSDTTRDGVEGVVQGTWGTRSRYRVGYTRMTHLTDTANVVQRTTPRDIADVSASHGMGPYTISGSLKRLSRYEGRRPAGGADTTYYPLGAFTRLDLNADRSFTVPGGSVRFALYGRNLTDERFQTVAGFPDIGRVFGGELVFDF